MLIGTACIWDSTQVGSRSFHCYLLFRKPIWQQNKALLQVKECHVTLLLSGIKDFWVRKSGAGAYWVPDWDGAIKDAHAHVYRDRSLHRFQTVQHSPHDSSQFVSVLRGRDGD